MNQTFSDLHILTSGLPGHQFLRTVYPRRPLIRPPTFPFPTQMMLSTTSLYPCLFHQTLFQENITTLTVAAVIFLPIPVTQIIHNIMIMHTPCKYQYSSRQRKGQGAADLAFWPAILSQGLTQRLAKISTSPCSWHLLIPPIQSNAPSPFVLKSPLIRTLIFSILFV